MLITSSCVFGSSEVGKLGFPCEQSLRTDLKSGFASPVSWLKFGARKLLAHGRFAMATLTIHVSAEV